MKNILILLCALLFCGCASQLGKNAGRYDRVEELWVEELVGNNLTRSPFSQQVVYLNARCETKLNGEKKYFLFTELIAPAEFEIQPGDSLVLNIDKDVFTFTPTNSPSFDGRKRFTTTFYPVAPEMITKLAQAKAVTLRIKGANGIIDKPLSRKNIVSFQNFATKCALIEKPTAVKSGG